MPRQNLNRSLQSEANVARRITMERERRGWTLEGTAKRMTDIGCTIGHTAIYKIEKGDPPRRISVDELVAFASVFGMGVEELLVPEGVVLDRATVEVFHRWVDARNRYSRASQDERNAIADLRNLLAKQGGTVRTAMERAMRTWIVSTYPTADLEEALEYFALTFADLAKDDTRWQAHFDRYSLPNRAKDLA